MTEQEWLASMELVPLLTHLARSDVSERKLRLFACACCRHVEECRKDKQWQSIVDVTERYFDGLATETEWNRAYDQARAIHDGAGASLLQALVAEAEFNHEQVEHWTTYLAEAFDVAAQAQKLGCEGEECFQCEALRDIVGNPFSPLPPRKGVRRWRKDLRAWLTSAVTALAQSIYTDRLFDRLPILADALEDAGCTNQDILAHCRGGGEHVRGCWVVDLLLGKE